MIRDLAAMARVIGPALALTVVCTGASAQTGPVPNAGSVARQNRQNQQEIEQQSLPQITGPAVVGPTAPEQLVGPPGGAAFLLKEVVFDHSNFITDAVLNEIGSRFVGKKIDNSGLQLLVKLVNDVFAKQRIITALAYLPKQDLKSGRLHVAIIEGRVGKVQVQGADHIWPALITSAVPLMPGAVVDVPQVERNVALFNAERNAQIKASLQPGNQFGLTDVTLGVLEPPRDALQAYVDNLGVDSVGRLEGGVNFQHYGIIGLDDRVTAGIVGSRGNVNANFGYNIAIDPWGGRLGVSAGAGQIHVISGPYTALDISGQSHNEAVSLAQPLYADPNWAFIANGQVSRDETTSDQSSFAIVNDVTRKGTVGTTVRYSDSIFNISVAPNYSWAQTNFYLTGLSQEFTEANGSFNASALLPLGFIGIANGAAQWASQKLLSSDQLFEIGGPTTVRGYVSESAAGYAGFYTNLELHHKLDFTKQDLDVFAFYDHGSVYSTFPAATFLNSVGAGLAWNFKNFEAETSVGIPVTRAFDSQPDYTVYFRLTARLP